MNEKTYSFLAHLLVVDDDEKIRFLLKKYLSEKNYLVSTAKDAIDAENILHSVKFDLIITDKMMPEKDGSMFVKDIRDINNQTPVIMLTAMGDIDNKIEGFENGIDDYITKPFEPQELLFRISNILKRIKQTSVNLLKFGNFTFDLLSENLKENGNVVKLTTEQRKIMLLFAKNVNNNISREELLKCLKVPDERNIDVAITRLRKKIENKENKFIINVRNIGYKFSI